MSTGTSVYDIVITHFELFLKFIYGRIVIRIHYKRKELHQVMDFNIVIRINPWHIYDKYIIC